MKSTYEPSEITNCGNAMFPRIDQENTYFTLKFCDEGIDYTNHLGRDIASWWSELVPQNQVLFPSYFQGGCNNRFSDGQGFPNQVTLYHLFFSYNRVILNWSFRWCHKYKIYIKEDESEWTLLTSFDNTSGNAPLSYEYIYNNWLPPYGTFVFPNQVSYKIVTENFNKFSVQSNVLIVNVNEIGPEGLHIFPALTATSYY